MDFYFKKKKRICMYRFDIEGFVKIYDFSLVLIKRVLFFFNFWNEKRSCYLC